MPAKRIVAHVQIGTLYLDGSVHWKNIGQMTKGYSTC